MADQRIDRRHFLSRAALLLGSWNLLSLWSARALAHFIPFGFWKAGYALWGWGYNPEGELGDLTAISRSLPVQVGTNKNWLKIKAGTYHTLAIKTDGTMWAWGCNVNYELGDGTIVDKSLPTQVGAATTWAQASAGWHHTVAIKTDKTLWGWGSNDEGEMADGTTVVGTVPAQLVSSKVWTNAEGGGFHVIATQG